MPDSTLSPALAPALANAALELPAGAALDRLLFSRIIALAASSGRPLPQELGLPADEARELIRRHVPQAAPLLDGLSDPPGGDEQAIEEADLRDFILEHRGHDGREADWLAAILARRSLASNHLWQDMGFANRGELNAMFARHFPALKARNSQDMKWKKFFYRSLCEREGLALCKSPNCEVCEDFTDCFGTEPGDPLSTLAHLSRGG